MPFNGIFGTFLKDKLVVCGYANSSCYSLAHYGQDWQLIGDTTTFIRRTLGDVQMSDTEWWITGGYNFSGVFSDTEVYTDGVGFKSYVDLPTKRFGHNVVKINDTHWR